MKKLVITAMLSVLLGLNFITVDAVGETLISNPNNTINASLSDSFYLVPSLVVSSGDSVTGGTLVVNNLPSDAEITFTPVEGITVDYNESKGLYTLSGTASAESYQTLFRSFYLTTGTTSQSGVTLSFTIKTGSGNGLYYSSNGHYYEYVSFASGENKDWHSARTYASNRYFNERQGYLVTITSAEENAFISEKVQADSWIGASDEGTEGTWKWVTGPVSEQVQFWQDLASAGTSAETYQGYTVNGMYANWNTGEPNNAFGSTGEDHAQMYHSSGKWNDLYATNYGSIGGYIVEYGGLESSEEISGDYEETVTLNISSQFSIKFLDYNGAILQSNLYDSGSDLSGLGTPSDPSREGYTFTGWDASIPETMPGNNVLINAEYTVNQYTLEFFDDDDSLIQSTDYDFGYDLSTIDEPTPFRLGYAFEGWDVSLPNTMPSETVSLTATYRELPYYIVYQDIDENTVQITYHDGGEDLSSMTPPTAPEITGHSFDRWSRTLPSTMENNNIVITPVYSENVFELKFVDSRNRVIESFTYTYGDSLAQVEYPVSTEIRGYTFDTWDQEIPSQMPASDLVIKALYKTNSYYLNFVDINGNVLESEEYNYGDYLNVDYPTAPEVEGYTFTEWSGSIPERMGATDVTLTTKYSINSYMITYEIFEEEIVSDLDFNSLLNTLPHKSISGLSLDGWYYNGNKIDVTTFRVPANDIRLVAVYKDISAPKFSNLEDVYINEGDEITFSFSVIDNVDGDITNNVSYSIEDFNSLTAGVYTLTLSVEDSSGNMTEKSIKIYVDFKEVQPVEIVLADNGKVVDNSEKDGFVEKNSHLNEDVIWFYKNADDTHVVFDLLETEVYESLIVLYRPLDDKTYLVPTANAANWTKVVVGKGESREVVVPSSDTYEFITEYITVTGETITSNESLTTDSEDQMTFVIAHDNGTTILEVVDDLEVEPSTGMVPWYLGIGVITLILSTTILYVRKQSK